ncbi:Ig-like domain-containing domain [Spirosoma gilvum]
MCSLIFFSAFLILACQSGETTDLTIRWNDKRAKSLLIPKRLVSSVPADSVAQLLTVHLLNEETAIAGQYQDIGDDILFEPLIPFTRGLRYAVWLRDKPVREISIPSLSADDHPDLLAIYPTQDTVPENLLKIYLRFSRPMREGQSEKYVALIKNNRDTVKGAFLNLQPELWNTDRTMLTLWLDPGRIKRDLQPNKLLGAPLDANQRYQLVVSPNWLDQQGASLSKPTIKTFVTKLRDGQPPNPATWAIHSPSSGSTQPLTIAFGKGLDYSLLTETFHVFQQNGKPLSGVWQIGTNEKQSSFKPDSPWQEGRYTVRIESRLEDLAGNNLNRPFDRDITRKSQANTDQPFKEVFFEVR